MLAKTYNAVLIKPASQRRSHAGNPILYLGVAADMHHYRRHSELQYWCCLYQTDIAYKSDRLAQEIAAMRAFMVCRSFSVNGGMLACNGVIQGLPANGGGSRHNRRLILGHDRGYLSVLLYRWVTRLVVFEKVKWQTVILRGIWDQFLANQN